VLQKTLILVKELVRYGWMRCSAWVMRDLSRIVSTENGVFTTVSTAKMPQSFVLITSDLLVETGMEKEEFMYFTVAPGELFATTSGI